MNEHDKHKNDLRQFHHEFDMLSHIHSFNDTTKSRNSDQLKQTEEWKDGDALSGDCIRNVIKWHCCHEVNYESSFQICPENYPLVKNFVAAEWVIKRCFELDININSEYQINDRVEDYELSCLHGHWLEADFQGNTEAVVNSKDDNKDFKVNLFRMVDFKNACFVNFNNFSMLLKILIKIIIAIFNQELVTLFLLKSSDLV